ncbi:hypothetical protein D3C76_1149990 [compost metagenome]
MLFIDDKTTADRVIGFAVDHFVAVKGVDLHPVFMQRQVVATKTHTVVVGEIHFVLAVSKPQTTACFSVADKRRNGVNIHCVRHVTCQTHNNGDIGVVALTR